MPLATLLLMRKVLTTLVCLCLLFKMTRSTLLRPFLAGKTFLVTGLTLGMKDILCFLQILVRVLTVMTGNTF